MIAKIHQLLELEIRLLAYLQPILLLVLRLYWGYQFFLSGKGKLTNIDNVTNYFATLQIPMPYLNACAAGLIECVGGLLLLVGLGSRVITIPLILTMLVAYGTAHQTELTGLFSNPDGFVTAPPFLFLLASTIVLVFGPGWASVDELLNRYVLKHDDTNRKPNS